MKSLSRIEQDDEEAPKPKKGSHFERTHPCGLRSDFHDGREVTGMESGILRDLITVVSELANIHEHPRYICISATATGAAKRLERFLKS